MKINRAVTFMGLALGLCANMPLLAHHSVRAEYDMSRKITIQGAITRVEWMNPHARLWVDAKNEDGTVSHWELELLPPNTLNRMLARPGEPGRDFFKAGDQVGATLWRAKDGSLLGNALSITLPNGQLINLLRGSPVTSGENGWRVSWLNAR